MNIWEMLNKKDKGKIVLTCLLMVLVGLVSFVPILFMENYINTVIDSTDGIYIALIIGFGYLILQLINTLLTAVTIYFIDKQQIMIGTNLQKSLFEKYINITYSKVMDIDSSNMTNLLLEDISLISGKYLIPLTKLILSVSMIIFGLAYIIRIQWILSLVILPLGIITAGLNAVTEKRYYDNAMEKKNVSTLLWKSFAEIFRGIVSIRIYKREDDYRQIVNSQVDKLQSISNKQNKLEKINSFIASFLFMLTIGVVLIVTGILVAKKELTVGGMVAILMYNHMITDPLITILESRKIAAELSVSEKRLANVLNLKIISDNKQQGVVDEIKINNLSFGYDRDEKKIVLSNINLHIKPKESIAIMGETGSGKSTLCKLIAGLYDEYEGSIKYFFKGKEVDVLPSISYMYQNAYIFDDTVINNMKLSNPKATDEEINELINLCLLESVIKGHENSKVGINGEKLSGGEKARLRLATALLKKDVSVYIFDELSSSLDDDTFMQIMNNIRNKLSEKIVIFVEHNKLIKDLVDYVYEI